MAKITIKDSEISSSANIHFSGSVSGPSASFTSMTNVTSINATSVTGSFVGPISNINSVLIPTDAFLATGGTQTGAIRIRLPVDWNTSFFKMVVKVYDYATGESFDVHVSGYLYAGGPRWVSTSAIIVSEPGIDRDFTVRFGYDSTASRPLVYIGETSTIWSYLRVTVTEVHGVNDREDWKSGWDISLHTGSYENVGQTRANIELSKYATTIEETSSTSTHYLPFVASNSALTKNNLKTNSGITFIPNTGRVGIGTTSPNTTLEIVGGTSNSSNIADGIVQIAGANDVLAFTGQSNLNPTLNRWGFRLRETADGDFSIRDYRNSATRILINSAGNVGIGTTSPSKKLEVSGTIGAQEEIGVGLSPNGAIYQRHLGNNSTKDAVELHIRPSATKSGFITFTENAVADRWGIGVSGSSGDLRFYAGYPITGAQRLTIQYGGNVGIGATNPSYKLDVDGDIRTTGKFYVDSLEVINLDGNINVHDTRNVALSSDLGSRGVRWDFKTNATAFLSDGGSYTGVMTFQQWGDSSGGHVHLLGFTDNGNIWHRHALIGGTYGIWKRLIQEDNNRNVGIGTTTPSYKLDVSGDLRVTGSAYITGSLNFSNSPQSIIDLGSSGYIRNFGAGTTYLSNALLQLNDNNGVIIKNISSNAAASLTIETQGTQPLQLQPSAGNVGIGTLTPDYTLSVTGTLGVSGNTVLSTLTASNIQVDTITAREFYTQLVTASVIYESGSTKFGDTQDDLHQFTGSIDITGSARTSNLIISQDVGSTTQPQIQFIGSASNPITLKVLDDNSLSFVNNSGNELFNLDADLTGTIFSVTDGSGIPSIEVEDTGDITLAEFGGNVGVGTSSPSYKLDVSGTLRVTGASQFASVSGTLGQFNSLTVVNGSTSLAAVSGTIGEFTEITASSAYVSGNLQVAETVTADSGITIKNKASTNNYSFKLGVGTPGNYDDAATVRFNNNLSYYITDAGITTFTQNVAVSPNKTIVSTGHGFSNINLFNTSDNNNFDIGFVNNLVFKKSGVEKVRIDVSGNVGIGTNSPLTKLDVRGGAITAGTGQAPAGTEILKGYYGNGSLNVIGSEYSSGGTLIGFGVKPSTSSAGAFLSSTGIALARSAYISRGYHVWYTGGYQTVAEDSSVTLSTAMILDANGNLGVGTTNPGRKLTVAGGIELTTADTAINTANAMVRRGSGGQMELDAPGDVLVNIDTNNNQTDAKFAVRKDAGSELFRVQENGNVGIGTTTPSTTFHVNGNSLLSGSVTSYYTSMTAGTPFAAIPGGASDSAAILRIGAGNYNSWLKFDTPNVVNNNSKSFIGAVYNSNYSQKLVFYSGKKGNNSFTNEESALNAIFSQDLVSFHTVGAGTSDTVERLRIDGNGRVGIGTISPGAKLDVSGSTIFGKLLTDTHQFTGSIDITGSARTSNLIISPDAGSTVQPKIQFIGSSSNPIDLKVLDDNTLSFEGSAGQLFSISNNLTGGVIFSVSDVSGIPLLEADASGTVSMARFGTQVGIGTNTTTDTLTVSGGVDITGSLSVDGYSSSWGNTSGILNQGINVRLGTASAATWLITGTSNGTFRGGIQQLDGGNGAVWYTNGTSQQAYLRNTGLSINTGAFLTTNGSQTIPSYTFSNDTNTGMYRAAEDELVLVTNGLNRIWMDNNGLVGIGTSDPKTRLHIGAKVTDDSSYTYDTNALYVTHQTPTNTTTLNDPKEVLLLARQGQSTQAFGAAASFRLSRYENSSVNSRTRLDLVLAHGSFLISPTTVLTARSDGKIGIGTSSPTADLHLYRASEDASIRVETATAGDDSTINLVCANSTTGTAHIKFYNGNNWFAGALAGSTNFAIGETNTYGTNTYFAIDTSGNSIFTGSVNISGTLTATAKSFDIPHPTKDGMRLRYGSLEGPENAVYVRGIITSSTIDLPDHWTGLVDEETITVNLTPVGGPQQVWVEEVRDNKVILGGDITKCYYMVLGERKDIDKLVVEY